MLSAPVARAPPNDKPSAASAIGVLTAARIPAGPAPAAFSTTAASGSSTSRPRTAHVVPHASSFPGRGAIPLLRLRHVGGYLRVHAALAEELRGGSLPATEVGDRERRAARVRERVRVPGQNALVDGAHA